MTSLENLQALVEDALSEEVQAYTCHPKLKEAMGYSLLAGGKRLRPLLVLASGKRFGLSMESLLPMAMGIEMIHTYSLIHDDLPAMDNDDLRRGRPTSHKVFGEAIAILAGDALLNEGLALLMAHYGGSPEGAAAITYLANCYGKDGMIGGQVFDMSSEGKEISMDELQLLQEGKTAALFKGALVGPALLAGADQKEVKTLETMGYDLGLLFQIQDDILDVTANCQKLGKSTGKDQSSKKSTFVSHLGLQKAQEEVENYQNSLWHHLEKLDGNKELLVELFTFILKRDH